MNKLKNLLLVLASFAVSFLCVEGILRILEPPPAEPINYVVPGESTYSVPIPNAKRIMLGRQVSINELGYRGTIYQPARNSGALRIQIFGDSHTFGTGAPDDQTYPAVMERKLNNHRDQRYEVLNFGVGGHDFGSIAKHIEINVPKYNPDLVIFTFHAGDIISTDIIINLKTEKNIPLFERLRGQITSQSYFARLIVTYGASMARSLFGKQPPGTTVGEMNEIVDNGPHWRNFKTTMFQLNDELQNRCTRLIAVLFPSMIDFETTPAIELHKHLGSWLVENGIPTLDLLKTYQASNRNASELWATFLDHHPNEEGYTIAGEAVAEFVVSVMKSQAFPTDKCTKDSAGLILHH